MNFRTPHHKSTLLKVVRLQSPSRTMEGLPAQNLTRRTTTKRHPAHPLYTLLTLQLYHSIRQVGQGLFEPSQVGQPYLNSPKLQIRLLALLLTGLTRFPPLPTPNPSLVDPRDSLEERHDENRDLQSQVEVDFWLVVCCLRTYS